MEKFAQIPVIEHGVVFSDPWYDGDVYCQYRKDFLATDWLMKLQTCKDDDFISFTMTLGRPTALAGINTEPTEDGGFSIAHPARYDVQNVELGMDTAKIFCGLKEHFDSFPEEASIRTGTDGYFGDLLVFTCQGEKDPAGFFLSAGLEEIFLDEQALFDHFLSSFNAKEMAPEMFASRTDPNSLALKVLRGMEIKHANDAFFQKLDLPDKENER